MYERKSHFYNSSFKHVDEHRANLMPFKADKVKVNAVRGSVRSWEQLKIQVKIEVNINIYINVFCVTS